ncbi:TonB family protein [Marinoscillum luteum]|uniref:TonB family protein n=1 Tax=Marinoscillum luteum TaxID=861051 RepID=A0ABW7N4Q5_9BACT
MINYLIELFIIHSILMVGYLIFLREESDYSKLRAYLLGSTLLSMIVPLLHFPSILALFAPQQGSPSGEVVTYLLNPAMITAQSTSSYDFSFAIWFYALISIWFLVQIARGIIYLLHLERHSEYQVVDGIPVYRASNIQGSFTFFNRIFMDQTISSDQEEFTPMLNHESAHARLGHSYDILFLQLFRACFWWLPSAWWIQKEIKKIHEYQADAYALKSYSMDQYSSILISSILKSNGLSLASSFHDGLILKRLKAMKRKVTQLKPWKVGALTALCAILAIAFACNEQLDGEIKKMGEQSNAISFDQLPDNMKADLEPMKEQLAFIKLEVKDGDNLSDIAGLQDIDEELIHSMNIDKTNNTIYIAMMKDGTNFDYVAEKSKMDGEVFTMVESQPRYPGGMDAFYQYLGQEMKYPLQARKAGIEGRVYVQFIVEPDGTISEVTTLKGIGGGCDAEAERVMTNTSGWIPGEQRGKKVRVRMVLPLIFKLNNEGVANGGNSKGTIIINEVENVNDRMKINANLQEGVWTGTVYAPNGQPLAGVNIVEKNTTSGTVSDRDGSFRLKLINPASEVILSSVGYESVKLSDN